MLRHELLRLSQHKGGLRDHGGAGGARGGLLRRHNLRGCLGGLCRWVVRGEDSRLHRRVEAGHRCRKGTGVGWAEFGAEATHITESTGDEGALATAHCAQSGAETPTSDSELFARCSAATATSSASSARSARSAKSTNSSPAPGHAGGGRLAMGAAVPPHPVGPRRGESSGGPGGSEGGCEPPPGEDCCSSSDHPSSRPQISAAAAAATGHAALSSGPSAEVSIRVRL
eukprot:scaffold47222_cov72-Phaeocystis_antarctica.AAC.3